MTENIVIIFDAVTGKTIERPMTTEEIAERVEIARVDQERIEARNAKIAARESALAKLAALGLTEEEIGAL